MLTDRPDDGSVHVLRTPDATRVVLTGEIDAQLGPELRGAVDDALGWDAPVEVDARHVTFMDSTGLSFLARLAAAQGSVVLRGASELVREMVEVTGLGAVVRMVGADDGDGADDDEADDDRPGPGPGGRVVAG